MMRQEMKSIIKIDDKDLFSPLSLDFKIIPGILKGTVIITINYIIKLHYYYSPKLLLIL